MQKLMSEEKEWILHAQEGVKRKAYVIPRLPRDKNGDVVHRDENDIRNRNRYHVFQDPVTGVCHIQDGWKVRYERMRSRIVAWADVLKGLNGDVYYRHITLTYDTLGTMRPAARWTKNDVRYFSTRLRAYIGKRYPDIIVWGMAWVGEIQPTSKQYHYELMIATSKRIYFKNGVVEGIWDKGFIKIKEPMTPWYLVAYCKKKNQKDYWYFPRGARGFGVWVSPVAVSGEYRSKVLLRFKSLKIWQMNYLCEHATGDDLVNDFEDILWEVRAPPGKWVWKSSWVNIERAEEKAKLLTETFGKVADNG